MDSSTAAEFTVASGQGWGARRQEFMLAMFE
jgi:hypothetical protein